MSLACSKKAGATSKKGCRAWISAKSPKWIPPCSRCFSPGCATPRRASRKSPLPTFPNLCRRSHVCTAWTACCPPPRRTTERHRGQAAREALRRRARARGREPRDRAGRVLRPARPQWRRQDHPHQRDCRLGAARFRGGKRDGRERGRRLPARAAHARRGAPGAGVRPVLHRARDAAHPVGLLRHPRQRRLDRRGDAPSGPDSEGKRQYARAVGRHEAPRAGGAGAGAQAAGDRARRADRRRRRRAPAGPMAVRAPAQPRRSHDRADYPLPRGGRTSLQPHRDAEGRPRCRARLDQEPARDLFGPAAARAARCGAAAGAVSGAGDRARRTAVHAAPAECPRARGGAGEAARERHRHRPAGGAAARSGRSVPATDPAAVVTVWFVELPLGAPLWAFAFALLGAALLGALGLIAGIVSEKIDQLAAFQNFVIMPLSFLSGVFYSIHSLPGFWQKLSHANPFFYMVDGFRYGFFGASDVPPHASLAVVGVSFLAVSLTSLGLLKAGYKLRY